MRLRRILQRLGGSGSDGKGVTFTAALEEGPTGSACDAAAGDEEKEEEEEEEEEEDVTMEEEEMNRWRRQRRADHRASQGRHGEYRCTMLEK